MSALTRAKLIARLCIVLECVLFGLGPLVLYASITPPPERLLRVLLVIAFALPMTVSWLSLLLRRASPLTCELTEDDELVLAVGPDRVARFATDSLVRVEIRSHTVPVGIRHKAVEYDIWAVMTNGCCLIAPNVPLSVARRSLSLMPCGDTRVHPT